MLGGDQASKMGSRRRSSIRLNTDLKIDVPPNSVETLTDQRVAAIRRACEDNGIHVGIHTLSAVNVAEVAPHVRDGVDRYLFGHLDACKRLGGEWMVVHADFISPATLRCGGKLRSSACSGSATAPRS
jgi:sugar phosphate isomerase/epimerase